MSSRDSVLIAAAALALVLLMLLWGIWFILGIIAEHFEKEHPQIGRRVRTMAFSLALIVGAAWFIVNYQETLTQILRELVFVTDYGDVLARRLKDW